jgi:hypothetical protein
MCWKKDSDHISKGKPQKLQKIVGHEFGGEIDSANFRRLYLGLQVMKLGAR